VVLPITIETKHGINKIELHNAKDLQRAGYLDAAKWFNNAENIWKVHRTEKSKNMSSNDRLNFQRGLTDQNLNNQFVVLYNTSGKDANAVVIDRTQLDLEFLADHKAYIFTTSVKEEAFYLCSFLNSTAPNLLMKDFQSRGLFGARDVHKKILDVFFPKFNEKNKKHLKLALLSEQAHAKAKAYLEANLPKQELSAIHLGRYRVELKKHLQEEMEGIDGLVEEMVG
jgi:hypothetical protein